MLHPSARLRGRRHHAKRRARRAGGVCARQRPAHQGSPGLDTAAAAAGASWACAGGRSAPPARPRVRTSRLPARGGGQPSPPAVHVAGVCLCRCVHAARGHTNASPRVVAAAPTASCELRRACWRGAGIDVRRHRVARRHAPTPQHTSISHICPRRRPTGVARRSTTPRRGIVIRCERATHTAAGGGQTHGPLATGGPLQTPESLQTAINKHLNHAQDGQIAGS